jgi:hypothetical protein
MHTLRVNIFAFAFASCLPLFAAAAHADQTPAPTTVWDYQHAVNPATNVRTTGPYDLEDLYRNSEGFPLPGNAQIR